MTGTPVVIVTGPDFLGKTWLCEHLVERYDLSSVRKVPDDAGIDSKSQFRDRRLKWAIRQILDWRWEEQSTGFVSTTGSVTIYDRFPYPDEMVYGFMDQAMQEGFERHLSDHSNVVALIVVLPRDLEAYRQRLSQSRDAELLPLIDTITTGFMRFTNQTSIPLLRLWVDDFVREPELERTIMWLRTIGILL